MRGGEHLSPDLVQKHATMNWVMDSEQQYTLPLRANNGVPESLQMQQNVLGQWEVFVVSGGKQVSRLGGAGSLENAFKKGEQWVTSQRPDNVFLSNRNAPWRLKPPTSGQIGLAKSLGIPYTLAKNSGELSDMIDTYNRTRRPKQNTNAKFVL